MPVINTGNFCRFWPILRTITPCFGVPEWFPCLTNPKVRLRVGLQHLLFWPILARFVDYYSLFWGPGVISTINEPWGAFTCRSSTLAVLVDSGPFHGLLLTFLGSRSNFHGCRTPRCAYVSVINNHSFGRFWPVSWTITQFWGHVVIRRSTNNGVFMCLSSTFAVSAEFGPFHGLLLTDSRSLSDFHD